MLNNAHVSIDPIGVSLLVGLSAFLCPLLIWRFTPPPCSFDIWASITGVMALSVMRRPFSTKDRLSPQIYRLSTHIEFHFSHSTKKGRNKSFIIYHINVRGIIWGTFLCFLTHRQFSQHYIWPGAFCPLVLSGHKTMFFRFRLGPLSRPRGEISSFY